MNQFTEAVEALKRKKVIKHDSDISKDLGISKSIVSEYRNFRPITEKFIELFNNKYAIHGITLGLDEPLSEVQEAKQAYETKGYNPTPPTLNNSGQTVLMKVAVGNSYAALELLSRLVSQAENRPIEDVKKEAETIARERLRIVEDMLFGLISLP